MLLPTTLMQQQSASTSPCKGGSGAVVVRVSTFRPPNVLRGTVAQERRPTRKCVAPAAEVVPASEVIGAQEQKKKIAIFVEPSPFSHVSGNDCDACTLAAAVTLSGRPACASQRGMLHVLS